MSALSVVQANLVAGVAGPVTNNSGGTSKGNPAAGGAPTKTPTGIDTSSITTGDRVGAGFLTTFMLVGVIGGAWWMVV